MFSRRQKAAWLLLFTLCLAAFAKTNHEKKTSAIAISGCLHKGIALDRFSLIGQNGKTYALRSSSVKLAEHVGHTVAINGQIKHDQKRDDYDFEGSEVSEGYGKSKAPEPVDVVVTSLKVLSGSCR